MSGIQIRLLMPCISAVVVKKNATLEICDENNGPGGPKKDSVMLTIATVGPAARKLHRTMAAQTTIAM